LEFGCFAVGRSEECFDGDSDEEEADLSEAMMLRMDEILDHVLVQ
jgi:hypothetical protein